MITLTIDGQKIQAEEGQTILDVCRKNSIAIPTLCSHPVLEPYGACRLCTVEVTRRGWTNLQAACTHPAWDGLEVKTMSAAVAEARKVVLGLMLSRTPNVPIIKQLAADYGVFEPPYPVANPDEKCILCGLCVRVCNDMVKAHVLNFSQHGVDRVVGPPFM